MSLATNIKDKNRKTDIVLVLKAKDGSPLNSMGLLDRRLFTGENNLHVKLDPQTCLWHLYYDNGNIPAALRQRWTSFDLAYKFVETYLKTRNLEISEIKD